ncbi:MAG: type I-U CRISPR-associated protein Csb2 [Planctomycetes bacterium]|nr:type I-U CRISPR-associated protein Csb2 [Planctomycetota bacterium]
MKLYFPGGRYHATPWGHHVNEGLIEWPPSPWRLLRALIACGFTTRHWIEIPPMACSLIEKLALVFPSYKLPEITVAHTRHYMPYIEGKDQKTTLVLDTFAKHWRGEADHMLIHWPCVLTSDETALLATLTHNLSYLGRSESWVEAELIPDASISLETFDAIPCQHDGQHDQRQEQVSLMAPIPANYYISWRKEQVDDAGANLGLQRGKSKTSEKLLRKQVELKKSLPLNLIACLTQDTACWKGYGWSHPPGSQKVLYWRPSQPMRVTAPRRIGHPELPAVKMMLLALTTPSGNKSALPSITRTLPRAELIHKALISKLGNGHRVNCPELTGKDEHDKPLQNAHRHAHILPLDIDRDRRIDHVLIFAPLGLSGEAQHAISSLRRTWMKGGTNELQLAIVGKGDMNDLSRISTRIGPVISCLIGPSKIWTSLTPFVPPRFLKKTGCRNDLIDQVRTELTSRGLPNAAVNILPLDTADTRYLRHFVRRRQRGNLPPQDACFALQISFCQSVAGPISLGYASHFGMGLFVGTNPPCTPA